MYSPHTLAASPPSAAAAARSPARHAQPQPQQSPPSPSQLTQQVQEQRLLRHQQQQQQQDGGPGRGASGLSPPSYGGRRYHPQHASAGLNHLHSQQQQQQHSRQYHSRGAPHLLYGGHHDPRHSSPLRYHDDVPDSSSLHLQSLRHGAVSANDTHGSSVASAPATIPPASPHANSGSPHGDNPSASGVHIYGAVYSGVPVFEMVVRGVAIMRRRADSYLNATQVLKVAGVEKGRRTKILEKEILSGEHEKVQGGYGKYQGTWVPFHRGVQLARNFDVEHLMQPLLDFEPPPPGVDYDAGEHQSTGHGHRNYPHHGFALAAAAADPPSSAAAAAAAAARPRRTLPGHDDGLPGAASAGALSDLADAQASPAWSPQGGRARKRARAEPATSHDPSRSPAVAVSAADATDRAAVATALLAYPAAAAAGIEDEAARAVASARSAEDRQRAMLMAVFLGDDDPDQVPEFLRAMPDGGGTTGSAVGTGSSGGEDAAGHTALHWAAALARSRLARQLVAKGASAAAANSQGETPLMRAVLVTNGYDAHPAFPALVETLAPTSLAARDARGRTLLHHIALTAGVRGRTHAARYYLECVLAYMAAHAGGGSGGGSSAVLDLAGLLDTRDRNGDTALNVAARVGCRAVADMLLAAGADPEVENAAGLRPRDFGMDDLWEAHAAAAAAASLDADAARHTVAGPSSTVVSIPPAMATNAAAATTDNNPVPRPAGSARVVFPGIRSVAEPVGPDGTDPVARRTRSMADAIHRQLAELTGAYAGELQARREQLAELRGQVRDAARDLAELRRQNQALRLRAARAPDLADRVGRLERALRDEVARGVEREAAARRVEAAVEAAAVDDAGVGGAEADDPMDGSGGGINNGVGGDPPDVPAAAEPPTATAHGPILAPPPPPPSKSATTAAALRQRVRLLEAHLAAKLADERGLRDEIVALKAGPVVGAAAGAATTANGNGHSGGDPGRVEALCRRLVAACCGVDLDCVDGLLEPLLAAVESDTGGGENDGGGVFDHAVVAGFLAGAVGSGPLPAMPQQVHSAAGAHSQLRT
ncbi:transcriptional regulator swi6 [Cladochytrium tenue]|nr:transcriptional regulator swi6 [Cladochytrium tenue]